MSSLPAHLASEKENLAVRNRLMYARCASPSNRNPLHLVEAHLVAPAIVELRGPGRGVVRHSGGVFERAAVFQIGCNPCRPEGLIADLRLDAGAGGAPADHGVGIGL